MSLRQAQFDALVRATSAELYRFAYWLCRDHALAQDLVQETFMRAWRALDDLREHAAAKPWLVTILRREHARLYERKRHDTEELEETATELPDARDLPTPERAGEDAIIRHAMSSLPIKYREPLLLQVLGGLSCDEIATELKLTPQAVMTQLFRARKQLKMRLSGHGLEAVS